MPTDAKRQISKSKQQMIDKINYLYDVIRAHDIDPYQLRTLNTQWSLILERKQFINRVGQIGREIKDEQPEFYLDMDRFVEIRHVTIHTINKIRKFIMHHSDKPSIGNLRRKEWYSAFSGMFQYCYPTINENEFFCLHNSILAKLTTKCNYYPSLGTFWLQVHFV